MGFVRKKETGPGEMGNIHHPEMKGVRARIVEDGVTWITKAVRDDERAVRHAAKRAAKAKDGGSSSAAAAKFQAAAKKAEKEPGTGFSRQSSHEPY